LNKYEQEEDDQWTMVLSKKSRRAISYADVVHLGHLATGANRVPIGGPRYYQGRSLKKSVFDQLSWPSGRVPNQ
jgi:hypothetical protein